MRLRALGSAISLVTSSVAAQTGPAPVGDYHQHLYSPAVSAMISTPARTIPLVGARELIVQLDSAGIRHAAVLSLAYMFGAVGRSVENEQAKVRAENDWTAAQAALYPDRLRAFCSVNPIKPYALEEITYCASHPALKRGLKLHFGNSDVRTDIPEQLEQLKKVFKAANDAGMAIIVHMHANINNRRPYGVEQGKVFLEQLVPQAPDVTIQIAHLAGAGGAASAAADSVVGVFADAFARNDPRTKNLWFDLTLVADRRLTPELGERAARRIRQIGTSRMLFGSDAVPGTPPSVVLSYFWKLPLTSAEFGAIARNVPPYMR